ncbi:MAG: YigZ family protein [Bacteroidales bacterium]|nr:YigZ family protein [Bacteroidales bacterium]
MDDIYKTISAPSEGFFKDRLSKFYAFAYPVNNEEQIREIQKELRKKFHDARHHVYAFILGKEKENFRYSDDGEPANSSGPPVLNAIKSFDLTDILVVVIRYFGGKKLGVPGLINAYRTAAEEALTNAKILEQQSETTLTLNFEYSQINRVMYILKKEEINIISQNFSQSCEIKCSVRDSKFEEIKKFLDNIGVEVK